MAAKEPVPDTSSARTATKSPAGPIIIVIGPPGAGKANLCAHICKSFPGHFRHLSVGRYLRELFSNDNEEASSIKPGSKDTETGCLPPGCFPPDEIEKYVREGRTLPPKTIIPLIKAKLLSCDPSSSAGWLIDGFPRNVKTALAFEREIKKPTALIEVTCDHPHIAHERFLNRQRTTPDTEERFRRRMKEFDENFRDIAWHYCAIEFIMNVDSGEDGWINGVLDLHQDEFKGLVALTGLRQGQ